MGTFLERDSMKQIFKAVLNDQSFTPHRYIITTSSQKFRNTTGDDVCAVLHVLHMEVNLLAEKPLLRKPSAEVTPDDCGSSQFQRFEELFKRRLLFCPA